jgi:hypothetical protein
VFVRVKQNPKIYEEKREALSGCMLHGTMCPQKISLERSLWLRWIDDKQNEGCAYKHPCVDSIIHSFLQKSMALELGSWLK